MVGGSYAIDSKQQRLSQKRRGARARRSTINSLESGPPDIIADHTLGNPDGMGVFPFDQPRILIEPFRCASFLLLQTFALIAAISQATDFGAPLANDPEHPAAFDLFRERTLSNMKLFCRPVAVL